MFNPLKILAMKKIVFLTVLLAFWHCNKPEVKKEVDQSDNKEIRIQESTIAKVQDYYIYVAYGNDSVAKNEIINYCKDKLTYKDSPSTDEISVNISSSNPNYYSDLADFLKKYGHKINYQKSNPNIVNAHKIGDPNPSSYVEIYSTTWGDFKNKVKVDDSNYNQYQYYIKFNNAGTMTPILIPNFQPVNTFSVRLFKAINDTQNIDVNDTITFYKFNSNDQLFFKVGNLTGDITTLPALTSVEMKR